jgi:hypothetical protein
LLGNVFSTALGMSRGADETPNLGCDCHKWNEG